MQYLELKFWSVPGRDDLVILNCPEIFVYFVPRYPQLQAAQLHLGNNGTEKGRNVFNKEH